MEQIKRSHHVIYALFCAFYVLHLLRNDCCKPCVHQTSFSLSNIDSSTVLYMSMHYRPRVAQTNLSPLAFRSTSMGHLAILLLLSGQVEINPGPSSAQEYPCAVCCDEVCENDHAILCDVCNQWCHITCVGISSQSYQRLVNRSKSFAWSCFLCGSMNIMPSVSLQGSDLSDDNMFSLLRDLDEDTDVSNTRSNIPLTSTPAGSPDGTKSPPKPCFSSPRPSRPTKNRRKIFKVIWLLTATVSRGAQKERTSKRPLHTMYQIS